MNIYRFRKNYFFNHKEGRAKVVFKTKETNWLGTSSPSLILMSIYSAFHEGIAGRMKMEAFISTIKEGVKGDLTILMTDMAHEHVLSLEGHGQIIQCKRAARLLEKRFSTLFSACKLVYWNDYVKKHPEYTKYKTKVLNMYDSDPQFRWLVRSDAYLSYTPKRLLKYPDSTLYLKQAVLDIFEQCICFMILKGQGYRFQFYPGEQHASIEYLNQVNPISFIHVFIAIERKKLFSSIPLKVEEV